jgi:hypothetical protein
MSAPRRFFLTLTLGLLLLGLAAHAMPTSSFCACIGDTADLSGESGLEACLVCQLQNGAIVISVLAALPDGDSSGANHPIGLYPLEHNDEVPHPPILF